MFERLSDSCSGGREDESCSDQPSDGGRSCGQQWHDVEGGRAVGIVARGSLGLNGEKLAAGDGVAIEGERLLLLEGARDAEVLLFDLQ